MSMGPFMRLDIPRVIHQYNLFDEPGICKRYILYTDSDTIFPNTITRMDVEELKDAFRSSGAMLSYGREYGMAPRIVNNGVMLMDVAAFEKELPSILEWTVQQPKFPEHDQTMLNNYFQRSRRHQKMRHLMDVFWNFKAYWKMPDQTTDSFKMVKVLHFHGPKPGNGLEHISTCNVDQLGNIPEAYHTHILQGVCCDQGKTATWAVDLFQHYGASSPEERVCGGELIK